MEVDYKTYEVNLIRNKAGQLIDHLHIDQFLVVYDSLPILEFYIYRLFGIPIILSEDSHT